MIAVLLTGSLRTIKITIKYFKENIILNSDVHVFACIQNDTLNEINELNNWFNEQLGDNLKYIHWFNLNSQFIEQRELLLSIMNIDNDWKNYLRNSGSMIEYSQLQIAYYNLCYLEQKEKFNYNYIIKCRTDSIYTKPIDFHWLNWSNNEVKNRIEKINEILELSNIEVNKINTLKYFMNTIISEDLITNISNINAEYLKYNDIENIELDKLNEYIKNGSYILTIRQNHLFIIRRNLFYLIPSIGSMYGTLRFKYEDNYWFNAENQFRASCFHSNLNIFNYNTIFEDKSLYEYDKERYFDENYNLINNNMLWCCIRN